MLRRVLLAAALVATAVGKESKDCDPKKDSGCNKFISPFYPNECWATDAAFANCKYYFYVSAGPGEVGVMSAPSLKGPWTDPL